jgi:hypothetical protein
MSAYAYAIKVNYEREIVSEYHQNQINAPLTVDKIAKVVGEASFTIEEGDTVFDDSYTVSWYTQRLETDEEMQKRIEKGEKYNSDREEFLKTGKFPK